MPSIELCLVANLKWLTESDWGHRLQRVTSRNPPRGRDGRLPQERWPSGESDLRLYGGVEENDAYTFEVTMHNVLAMKIRHT